MKKAAICGLLLALMCLSRAGDNADIEIYTDYQCGVWNITSTGSLVLNSTTYAHSFTNSIWSSLGPGKVLNAKHMWEGLSSNGLTYIEFWILLETGTTDMHVKVKMAQGWPQWRPPVSVTRYATVLPLVWTRIRIPAADLGMEPNQTLHEIAFENTGTVQRNFFVDDLKIIKNEGPARPLLTVDARMPFRSLSQRMFGVGTYTWDWELNTTSTRNRLLEAGIQFMNFPGGSSADEYDWLNNRSRRNGATGFINTDQYLATAESIGADKMITANYGSGTVEEAVEWLRYTNITRNANVIYWSIGNEVYADSYDLRPPPYRWDALTYAEFVSQCIIQMKAIDPRVKIGVSGTIGEDSYPQRVYVTNPRTGNQVNGWSAVLFNRLRELGTLPDYVDFHIYPHAPGTESDSQLLQYTNRCNIMTAPIRQALSDYFGPAGTSIPINITETNSTWMPIGKQSTSLLNAIYLADAWGYMAKAKLMSFVWWNLHNPATDMTTGNWHPSLYGWRTHANFGILSMGTPVGVAEPLNTPYPTFYAIKMLKQFARPGDVMFHSNTNNELLQVYGAMNPTNGKLRIMVINKAKAVDYTADISLQGYVPQAQATKYHYGMTEDLTRGDITTSQITVNPAAIALSFPRYSITVVDFDMQKSTFIESGR